MSKEQRPKSGALPQDSAAKEGDQLVTSWWPASACADREFQNRDVHKSLGSGVKAHVRPGMKDAGLG